MEKIKEIRGFFINTSEAARELLSYSSGSYRGVSFKTTHIKLLNSFYKLHHIVICTSESQRNKISPGAD